MVRLFLKMMTQLPQWQMRLQWQRVGQNNGAITARQRGWVEKMVHTRQ